MAKKFFNGIDLTNKAIINVADPTNANDGVNKNYVDNLVQGLQWKQPVRAATTSNIANLDTGAPNTLDGVTLAAGNRVLVKNQTTTSANGIYVVTTVGTGSNGVWARAADMDAASEFPNATVYVSEGTTQADKAFTQTANAPITVGTTAISWVEVGGGTTYSAGNGLSLAGSTFSVQADGGSLQVSGSGVRIADAAAGAGLMLNSGVLNVGAGTGITVGADDISIDNSVVVRKFAADCAATTNPQTFTHNLGTLDVNVQIFIKSTGELVESDITATNVNSVSVDFGGAPTAAQYRVVVMG